MGYTHYWYQRRALTEQEWELFTEGFQRLLTLDGIPPLARMDEDFPVPPSIENDSVSFNGVGEDGHENLYIDRTNTPPSWRTVEPGEDVFDFCKTARKPYDVVVTAVLSYLGAAFPTAFPLISSDGDPNNWEAGVRLASLAWPQVEINVPKGVYGEDEE